MTGYTLDSTVGAWPQLVMFTIPGYLFTHLGFPECSRCLEYNIYSRLCYGHGLKFQYLRITDGYFLAVTIILC